MPPAVEALTYLFPMRHYFAIYQSCVFGGSSPADVWPDFLFLLMFFLLHLLLFHILLLILNHYLLYILLSFLVLVIHLLLMLIQLLYDLPNY